MHHAHAKLAIESHAVTMNSKYFVSIIVSTLILFRINYGIAIIYIPPTEPVNTSCPSSQKICFTLNEWIERGTHSFTSGATVILLSGVHFINSTVNSLSIENVSSVTFSGQLYGKTIIECNNRLTFGFKFYNVNGVYISNVQFKLCAVLYDHNDIRADAISTIIATFNFALAFIKSQNITLNSVNITNGGALAAIDSKEESAFQIYNSMLSCTSFVIIQARCNLNIKKTSFQNVTNNKRYKLMINIALKVTFMDVTFQNNVIPLTIGYVEYTEFKGHVHRVHDNVRQLDNFRLNIALVSTNITLNRHCVLTNSSIQCSCGCNYLVAYVQHPLAWLQVA